MIVVIILGLLAMFFSWLESSKQFKHGLKVSFSLIFIFLASRFDYGNDYISYLNIYGQIKSDVNIDFFDKKWGMEAGWVFLNWLFIPFGFFGLIIFISAINSIVFYFLFKNYVPPKYYWFALFLYIFNENNMLVLSSAMRQHIAILIFILAIHFLIRKNLIVYIGLVIVSVFFHTSSIILVPVALLGIFKFNINFKIGILIIIVYLSLFAYLQEILGLINSITSTYLNKYTIYEDGTILGSGLGVALSTLFFIIIVYFSKNQSSDNSLFFKLGMLSFITIPISISIILFSRIGMYFQPFLLITYPIILYQKRNPLLNLALMNSLIFIHLYSFFMFFQSNTYSRAFANYQTIFSVTQWY